ncbi:hypothetical protein JCM8115_003883 [Rhodotorula mucilaginosa]|uniref:MICOS complex subunit n=1 Tax=Rhodotorula mucilaginosa TaxID=5537 RepID=A0A9P6VT64_RHOMI|nr:hypothetical protein C6P46_001302 [Rhodotorula mucilaginosa]TKA54835.1 hypothetical protein B0A53_02644 [Rhodotorula sp. CCFEE 5036]
MATFAAKIAAGAFATASAGIAFAPALRADSPSPAPILARPADPEVLRSKLSIYDSPAEPAILVPVKSPLQDEVAAARVAATEAYSSIKEHTADVRQTWLGWEKQGESALKSVISDRDQLNPNALYVGIATLAGSIVGRNRFFLVRLALPPLFFIGSAAYFLPHSYAKAAEKAGVPQQWRDLRGRVDHAANEVKKVSQEQSGKP